MSNGCKIKCNPGLNGATTGTITLGLSGNNTSTMQLWSARGQLALNVLQPSGVTMVYSGTTGTPTNTDDCDRFWIISTSNVRYTKDMFTCVIDK